MKEDRLRSVLATIMIWGVALAAGFLVAGGVIFLTHHAGQPTGDHKFTGEPADLRHPVAIVKEALKGNDDCLIQIGVLLLLFNPFVRVALAAWGYAAARDWLYAAIGGLVLAVLVVSYFV
jgi:uncharacterized membrane protein